MSPLAVLDILMRRWKLVLGLPLLFAALVIAHAFLAPKKYAASSRMTPQQPERSAGASAGLAAQFGIPLESGGGGESVQFYAELLKSRDLLEQVALSRFTLTRPIDGVREGTLLEILDVPGANQDAKLQNIVGRLKGSVIATVDPRANLVDVVTIARTEELSVAINRRLLELVNDFNIHRRRNRAVEERTFAEARMKEARAELASAENALEDFLLRNRRYENAPQLLSEFGRLQRSVEFRQAVHTSLAQRWEQSRLDAVRTTPVVTIIEGPERSAVPVGRPARALVLAIVFGGVMAIALALTLEYVEFERRRNPDAFTTLNRMRARWSSRNGPV